MKLYKWSDIKKRNFSKKKLEELDGEIEQELFEMDLRALREVLDLTQAELAKLVKMTQSQISKLEKRKDHKLSTMRRIVESLGGKLEVIAKFGDKRVRLHFIEQEKP
jgi:transcriptional regulator with XRE-family HTH domain